MFVFQRQRKTAYGDPWNCRKLGVVSRRFAMVQIILKAIEDSGLSILSMRRDADIPPELQKSK